MNSETSNEKEQNANILAQLSDAIEADDTAEIETLFEALHPAEIAHYLEALPGNQREQIWPQMTQILVRAMTTWP